MTQKSESGGRSIPFIAETALGIFWGSFLYFTSDKLFLNTSGHPWSPAAVFFVVLSAVFSARLIPLPILTFRTGAILHFLSAPLAFILIGPATFIYHLIPWTDGNSAITLLTGDSIAAILIFGIPAWTGRSLIPRIRFPSAVLAGTGAGILVFACILSRGLSHMSSLLIAEFPAVLLAGFLGRHEPARENIPEREYPHYVSACTFFLISGTLILMGGAVRIMTGLTHNSIAAYTAVCLLSAGAGSFFGYKAVRLLRGPLVSVTSIVAGAAGAGGFILTVILYSKGLFLDASGTGNPVREYLVSFLAAGGISLCAGILLRILSEDGFRFSGSASKKKWCFLFYFVPFILTSFSLFKAILVSCCIISCSGYVASVRGHDRADRRLSAGILILSAILFIAGFFSRVSETPPGNFSNALILQSLKIHNLPDYIRSRYQTALNAENPTGAASVLRNRDNGITYTFVNGELLFPDEFYADDTDYIFELAALLKRPGAGVLYCGLTDSNTRSRILSRFNGQVIFTELFPGISDNDTENGRSRIIKRNLRHVLQTSGTEYGVIINVSPPPSSPAARGMQGIEYFRKLRSRLAPDGIILHYLPCYKIHPEVFNAVLAAFTSVFKNRGSVFVHDNYCILAGGLQQGTLSLPELRTRESGSSYGDPEYILAGFITSGDRLQRVLKSFPLSECDMLLFQSASETGAGKHIFINYQFITSLRSDFRILLTSQHSESSPSPITEGRTVLSEARQAWMLGDLDGADKLARKAEEISGKDPRILDFLIYMQYRKAIGFARSHYEKNQLNEAVDYYGKAASLKILSSPESARFADAYLGLALGAQWPASYNYARQALDHAADSMEDRYCSFGRDVGIRALLKLNLVSRAGKVADELFRYDPEYPGIKNLKSLVSRRSQELKEQSKDPQLMEVITHAAEIILKSENRTDIEKSITHLLAGGAAAVHHLEKLYTGSLDEKEKKRILHVFSRIGGDPALAFTRKVYAREEKEIQRECLGILGMYGDRNDVPLIGEFLKKKYPARLRSHAVIVIGRMKHPESVMFLLQALDDPEEAVRMEAKRALSEVHPMFSGINTDKPLGEDINSLKKKFSTLEPSELGWKPFPGE